LYSTGTREKILISPDERCPTVAAEFDTPLRCRIPAWMSAGLKEVAKQKRIRHTSDPVRWAIEDFLAKEGITAPATDSEPTAA